MVVPIRVRLAGTENPSRPAHTLDATERGVRFAGYSDELNPGDIIEIQHRHERSLFRVIWIHSPKGSFEKHVGAECVFNANIWGNEFQQEPDEYEQSDD